MNALKTSYLILLVFSVVFVAILSSGCTSPTTSPATPTITGTQVPVANATTAPATPAPHDPNSLLIATTTSLYDTGLLNRIQDIYQNETGITVKITSQGTGQAIQLAQRGDADLLLVHSPSQEQTFINNGYGINQRCFAYNYFVIVGPASDPAGIANMTPSAALAQIRALGLNGTPGVYFASRGDQSGTHTAEQNLWAKAGLNYSNNVSGSGPWYLSVGKGMGDTLTFANQKGAYTLSDEGTFLAYKSKLNLTILIQNNSQTPEPVQCNRCKPCQEPECQHCPGGQVHQLAPLT